MKNKNVFLVQCLLLLFLNVNAQRAIPTMDWIRSQNFNELAGYKLTNWNRDVKGSKSEVKNGVLKISNSKDQMSLSPLNIWPWLDWYFYDFEFTMDITFDGGKEECEAGFLVISREMNFNAFNAYITSSGKFGLTNSNGIDDGPTADSHILVGQTNKLVMRKFAFNYQIFVNDNLLLDKDINEIRFNEYGQWFLFFKKKQKTFVDNFKIHLFKPLSSPGLVLVPSEVPGKRDYKNTVNNFSFLYDIDPKQKFIIRESKDKSRLEIRMADGLPDIQLEVIDYSIAYIDTIATQNKRMVQSFCPECIISSVAPVKYKLETGIEVIEVRHELSYGKLGRFIFVDLYFTNPATKQKIIHLQSYGKLYEGSEKISYFAMKDVIGLSLKMK